MEYKKFIIFDQYNNGYISDTIYNRVTVTIKTMLNFVIVDDLEGL